ncbi:MAG: CehA/McbA family metallohydrolase [Acidobacteriota bacterium]|nr:CehA/McbA family metallohydrolase [Acidobacteriota bacterium]
MPDPRDVTRGPAVVALVAGLLWTAPGAGAQMTPLRYPAVAGGQIRVENYLVPRVTSWPAYPAWSPDGTEIAFALDGRLWVLPAAGGEARQLTGGPDDPAATYDFEPDWSPDGRFVVFSRDVDGNLDIWRVGSRGGIPERLTNHPAMDFHPRAAAGGSVVYSSAESGSFDIRMVGPDGSDTLVWGGDSNEIQPDPGPEFGPGLPGGFLVAVSNRSDYPGTGGIFRIEGQGDYRELHVEETTFRTRPAVSPDGSLIAFASDIRGSYDLFLLPADGGLPFRLTRDDDWDEKDPAWSPDGQELVFTTNRNGRPELEVIGVHGGGSRPLPVSGLERAGPAWGRLRIALSDAARVTVVGADGRAYAPRGIFRRIVSYTETHYFHAAGEFSLELPPGPATVRIKRGVEYRPWERRLEVRSGAETRVEAQLERFTNLRERGWMSGDTHVHDLHAGDLRITPADLVGQAEAEAVEVIYALIHVDGSRTMGDPARFVAGPHPASTSTVFLRYGQEYRMPFGHRTFLNPERLFYPLTTGVRGTAREAPFPPLFEYIRRLRAEQGDQVVAGMPHPYFGYLAQGIRFDGASPSEIPLDAALGVADFFDINCIPSSETGSAAIYARLLNAGFRLAAAGGSDTFSDTSRDPPLGTGRTYVRLPEGAGPEDWPLALRTGRSFSTNGPLLELDVDGRGMGDEIERGGPARLPVRARAVSAVPMERLVVLVNGEVWREATGDPGADPVAGSPFELEIAGELELDDSAWVAVRAEGPRSVWTTDSSLFAHSTPVYVLIDGREIVVEADRRYLETMIEDFGVAMARRDDWLNEAQRELVLAGVEEGLVRVRARKR